MAFGGSPLWRLLLTYALALVFGCLAWWYSNGSVWWSLGAAYLPSFFDGSQHLAHGRHWPWFQRLPIWRWVARNSFSSTPKVLQEAPLPASQQVLLGLHPHGVISAHHLLLMTDGISFLSRHHSRERRDMIASVLFRIPVIREILLWFGNVTADKAVFKEVLASGRSGAVYPGGEQEQLRSQVGTHRVYLERRKGFVKLALQHNVPLVPVYCFGETDLYHASSFLHSLRMWLVKRLRMGIPLFYGRSLLCCLAFRRGVRMTIVTGRPVFPPVPHSSNNNSKSGATRPDPDAVDRFHSSYCKELHRMFDARKAECGYPDATLQFD